MIRLLVAAVLAAACGQSNEPVPSRRTGAAQLTGSQQATLAQLRTWLAEARTETTGFFSGEVLWRGHDVRGLVDDSRVRWWEMLTPVETFLLFELSPVTAARAPIEIRARAYCAGVEEIPADWWGTPGASSEAPPQRLLALGLPVAKCLVTLFDSDRELGYLDGEGNAEAEAHAWTVADLAAGFVAIIVGATYDEDAVPAVRATNRSTLRARLQQLVERRREAF